MIEAGISLCISPPGVVTVTPPRAEATGLRPGDPVVDRGCREIGLCGPLLEPEEDLRLIKAISTVGSGLYGNNIQTNVNTFYSVQCYRIWVWSLQKYLT